MPAEPPKAVLAPAAGALLFGPAACGNDSGSGSAAAGSAALAGRLLEEGGRSPADAFFVREAGALQVPAVELNDLGRPGATIALIRESGLVF
ncbi:hypothetical protein ABZ260_18205 [Streptosporangium sp. NPDC006013]|uniref:hypothetical protein n=1 Tax=Streptosporangium sp. NPDC006013 TaxID=3155596 RepID=UPI0033ACBF12